MSDQDFNFTPPPPRRERKEFEPPPWERHLFEQLATEQEQEQQQAAEQIREQEQAVTEELEPAPTPEITVGPTESAAVDPPLIAGDDAADEGPRLDEVQLASMLFELRAEEVPATQVYARATLVAGTILLLIGIVMVIWSFVMIVVALQRPEQGRSGVYIGMTVLVFGAGFAGIGAWFVFKTLRQQGVL